jgi:hypothetical protein
VRSRKQDTDRRGRDSEIQSDLIVVVSEASPVNHLPLSLGKGHDGTTYYCAGMSRQDFRPNEL